MPSAPPSVSTPNWSALPVFAGLTMVWLALTWPWLTGQLSIPWDAKAYWLPQLQFMAQSLSRGEWPFWNPYVFAGHPQIADPQAFVFSPPFVALALLNGAPGAQAHDITLFLSILIASFALALWFRDQGWHWLGAVVAALTFAFGAAMSWRVQHVTQALGVAYVPIVMLLLDRALNRQSIAYGLGAGIVAAFLVLGRDQIALLSIYFLSGFVLWRLVSLRARGVTLAAMARPLAAAALVGALIIALPVLFTILLTSTSNRPEIDFRGAGLGSLHPAHFFSLIAPGYFSANGAFGPHWGPPGDAWPGVELFLAQNMGQLYLGAIPILLIGLGLTSAALFARDIRYMTAAFVIALLYTLGWFTPAFWAMHTFVPGVNYFRRPADGAFMIGFIGAIVAGYAAHRWATNTLSAGKIGTATVTALILAAFVAMTVIALRAGKLDEVKWAMLLAAACLAGGAAIIWAVPYHLTRRPLAVAVSVLAFSAADLWINNGPNGSTGLPFAEYEVLEPGTRDATIALITAKLNATAGPDRRDRVEFAGIGYKWPNASVSHRIDQTLGFNPLRLGLYSRATGAGDIPANPDQRKFSKLMPSYQSPLANLLGLRFIVSQVPLNEIDKTLAPGAFPVVGQTADGTIYENTSALPRVLFATSAQAANFEQMLTSGGWPNVDFKQTVLLESPDAKSFGGAGTAALARYSNNQVDIDVASSMGGYAILNDVWHPWWFAAVDGKPAELLRANVLFRAVAVPPGQHRVTLTFKPVRGALAELTAK